MKRKRVLLAHKETLRKFELYTYMSQLIKNEILQIKDKHENISKHRDVSNTTLVLEFNPVCF